jgi:hypothetical protein
MPKTKHMTAQKHTRHNNISLLWPVKEMVHLILQFSGLDYYDPKEGRKPKNNDAKP